MKERQKKLSYAAIESSLFFGSALLSAVLFLIFCSLFYIRTGLLGAGAFDLSLYIYLISLILSQAVLPTCTARLVSTRMERKHPADAVRLTRTLSLYATAAGAGLGVFFWMLGGKLSELSGNSFGTFSLRTIGITLWLMGYLGVMRGYYLGRGNSMLVALSAVMEPLVSVAVSLIIVPLFISHGQKAALLYGESAYTAAYAAQGAFLSLAAGTLITLIGLKLMTALSGGGMQEANEGRRMEGLDSVHRSIERLLLPVGAAAVIVLLGPLLDFPVFGIRASSLYTRIEAVRIPGAFSAAMLCWFIPVLSVSGLIVGLFPALRYASALRDRKMIAGQIFISTKFTIIFSIFCCLLMIALRVPLANLLFSGEDSGLFQRLLLYGASFPVFASMALQKCAVLCGLGYFTDPLKNAIWAFLAHLVVLVILLFAVRLEMTGVLIANVAAAFVFWALNTGNLMLRFRLRPQLWRNYIIPCICAVPAWAGASLPGFLLGILLPEEIGNGRVVSLLVLMVGCVLGFFIYFTALFLTGTVRRGELYEMPLGTALTHLFRRGGII